MAGYSDDDSVGGYSDDQYSAGGYSDDQYSAGGYSDDDQHLEGGYSDDEQHAAVEDSDDDQDAPSGHCNNPVTTTKAHDYGGKQTITSNYGARQSEHSGFYQQTKKASYVNKQTGGYTCTTSKEVISTGNTFKERGPAGRVGTKNEYTTTDTWRVGDKNGYSEYWVQKGHLTVDYSGNSGSKSNYSGGSSKKYYSVFMVSLSSCGCSLVLLSCLL